MYGKAHNGYRGPKFAKYGKRTTRYPIEELDKWLANQERGDNKFDQRGVKTHKGVRAGIARHHTTQRCQ
jgi:hypothetical protein